MVLVVILVLAWLVLLGPRFLRRRSGHGDGVSSISSFHHQLAVLQHSRTAPVVAPAYRLRGDVAGEAACPVLTVVKADAVPRPALAFLGEPEPLAAGSSSALRRAASRPVRHDSRPFETARRQAVRRRRQDTLTVLALLLVCTLLIGCIPGAHAAWVITGVTAAALTGYVALLVHLRARADESERKLHYLHAAPAAAARHDPPPGYPDGVLAYPDGDVGDDEAWYEQPRRAVAR